MLENDTLIISAFVRIQPIVFYRLVNECPYFRTTPLGPTPTDLSTLPFFWFSLALNAKTFNRGVVWE